jgi:hypothetical protein
MTTGFSHVTTMTMAFLGNDYSVAYMPIEYAEREGKSKFHWFSDTQLYLLQVTRMVMMYRPMRVFMPLTLTLFLIGIGKLVFDIVTKDFRVATNTLFIGIAAVALFIVGLLADLIVQLNKSKHHVEPAAFALYEAPGRAGGDADAHGTGEAAAQSRESATPEVVSSAADRGDG